MRGTKKYISFLIVPHSTFKRVSFQISERNFYFLLALVGILLLLILFLFLSYGGMYFRTLQLTHRNQLLEKEYRKIASLERELHQLKKLDEKVRTMLGGDKTPPPLKLATLSKQPSLEQKVLLTQEEESRIRTPEMALLFEEQQERLRAIPSIWPVKGFVSNDFYQKRGSKGHPGLDIAAKSGSLVMATADGIVTFAGWNDTLGNLVRIDHGFGYTTLYGHNSQLIVGEGKRVKQGDVIAFVGSTGKSSAPHLHYEVHLNGEAIDPRTLLLH